MMNDKQATELLKFISSITDKKIRPFIDIKKLCDSGIYKLTIQMGTEHAVKHGDFNYLNLLFTLVDGTPHGNSFVSNLRSKLNFVFTDTNPRKLKKATAEQVVQAEKVEASKPITVKAVPRKVAKKEKLKVSHDLMDSRLMLPGGYGTGKRR